MTGSRRGGSSRFGKVVPVVAGSLGGLAAAAAVASSLHCAAAQDEDAAARLARDAAARAALSAVAEGRETFRFDTFGSEAFWGGQLRLHEAIAGQANGGVGPGVSPKTALAVGLKVDSERLPRDLVERLRRGAVNLDDPATTLALLKLDA